MRYLHKRKYENVNERYKQIEKGKRSNNVREER